MSLPELEVYYCERRKQLFEEGKKLKNIKLRERAYPLFAGLLKIDRILRKQTITVIGNHKKHKGQVIYACTHIGENDLENIYEVLKRGCWWFVGDPCVLYKDFSGLFVYFNGCIMLETSNKDDRKIAYKRAVELLKSGGSLMIYPEGARNGTENLPVMELFQGTARMSMEANVRIVPVAIEQYDKRFIINFGNEIFPQDFCKCTELTQKLRDDMATLKWEIWEREGIQQRKKLPTNYSKEYRKQFETRIAPYDTLATVERTRYHSKIPTPDEVFSFSQKLIPSMENAFLFRGLNNRFLL
jgi:1-acyl-sn-glycerol-3-phosphate acyltransferase